jgi:hypothetical protein
LILKPEDTATSLATGGAARISSGNDNPFSGSDIPIEIEVPKGAASAKETAAEADHKLHCVCPVCQSELRIPAEAASHQPAPVAEVVRKDLPPAEMSAETETASTAGKSEATPVPERERQIAVAREAHQVSLYPAMKPRLSYILRGEQPDPVPGNSPPAPGDETGSPGIKTMHE